MTIVAIIPARGGSKRIPRKNIRPFLGHPMIAWSIAAAQRSGLFDRIVVSTDDAEIQDIARSTGAEAPFIREAGLADDHTGVTEVVRDTIFRLSLHEKTPDIVCLIYATAPLLQPDDLVRGLSMLRASGTKFAISVAEFVAPIQRALILDGNYLRMREPENLLVRSQDLVPAFHDAGQFCWGTTQAWLDQDRVFVAPTAAVTIPNHRVQDIDTEADWTRAEALARSLQVEL